MTSPPAAGAEHMSEDGPLDAYLLVYADPDREQEFFAGYGAEEAAYRRFHQAAAAWTCRLFKAVAATGYGPAKDAR